MKPGTLAGYRVMWADADETRSDGMPHIPAYKNMRGECIEDYETSVLVEVKWDCDYSPSWVPRSWVKVCR